MKEIVGVRFKSVGKIYYFSPGDIKNILLFTGRYKRKGGRPCHR